MRARMKARLTLALPKGRLLDGALDLLRALGVEGVDQLLQNDLAGDGLRHLDNGREIEVFDQRPNRARGIARSLVPQ